MEVFVPPGTVSAIRWNLIIFCSLLWHSQSLCGLSLVFIIQGALFIALFDFIYVSINVNHENQQLNDSIQNVMAAVIIVIAIWLLSTYDVPSIVQMIFIH